MGRCVGRVELLLNLPSIVDFITIHDLQVAKAPDRTEPGIFPDGDGKLDLLLEQIIHYPLEETKSPIVNAVTFMYEHIIRSHPFVDCNKRTAIMSSFETCLMNRFYLKKIDTKTEVRFAKKVAKTTIDELGYDEICKYFDERIIPFQKFVAKELIGKSIQCPYCGCYHLVYPGICSCGKQLTSVDIKYHGVLTDYAKVYSLLSLQRLASFRGPRIRKKGRRR